MNNHFISRNRAANDKDSILADVKVLLSILYPAIQSMPKIERIEGAPREMKRALHSIIYNFSIAKECKDERIEYIRRMIGDFGVLLANFEICITQGLMTQKTQFAVAVQLERIEEGVKKWRNAQRSLSRQEPPQIKAHDASEVAASMK